MVEPLENVVGRHRWVGERGANDGDVALKCTPLHLLRHTQLVDKCVCVCVHVLETSSCEWCVVYGKG